MGGTPLVWPLNRVYRVTFQRLEQDVFSEWKTSKGLLLLYRDSLCKQYN